MKCKVLFAVCILFKDSQYRNLCSHDTPGLLGGGEGEISYPQDSSGFQILNTSLFFLLWLQLPHQMT